MKKLSDGKNILRDISLFSGSTYISQAMFFIRGLLNANLLGPALYGLWSGLNIILNYAAYLHLGTVNAMNREIPYYNGRGSDNHIDKARDATFTACIIMNFIASFILIFLTILFWKKLPLHEDLGLITIALLILVSSIHEFYQTVLISLKRFMLVSKASIIFSILSVILTLIMVPYFKVYGVYTVAVLTPLLYFIYLFVKEPYRLKICFDFRETLRLMRIGFPLVSKDFLDSMATGIAGIMVFTLLGKTSMGYYAVAMLASRFLMYFPNSINRTFEPYMYQRYGKTQDLSELKKYLFKPTFIMALLFPPILAFYYTGTTFFIRHFLSKYTTSIYPFFIILVARFFISFSPTAIIFITAINKQKYLIPAYLVSIAVISASASIFINMGFGILAVVFGLLLAFFFTGSVIFIYAISHYIKDAFKCLAYFGILCLPFLYMIVVLVFNEVIVSNSVGLFPDIVKLVIKLVILCIFSIPLIWIANYKTGILRDIFSFLKLDRLVVRIPSLCMNRA